MTTFITPGGENTLTDNLSWAMAVQYAAGTTGWIVPANDPLIVDQYSSIDQSKINAFAESHSGTSLDVTIDGGEAFVGGAWMAVDEQTTVSLAASTNDQTVYLGWNPDAFGSDEFIIALENDAVWEDHFPRMEIWTFDTDGSGVTSATDERLLGDHIVSSNLQVTEGLTVPVGEDKYVN